MLYEVITDTGVDFHPDNKAMKVFVDSVAGIKAYSVLSERTFSGYDYNGLIGHVKDPLLGEYKSSTLGYALPKDMYYKFEDSVVVTSLNLCIGYKVYSVKSNNNLKLEIYELLRGNSPKASELEGLPDNENSLKNIWDGSGHIASLVLPDIKEENDETAQYIYFDMLTSATGRDIASRLIKTDSIYNYSSTYDYVDLLHTQIFKGLYFQTQNSEDGTSMFQILDDSTRLTLGLDIFLKNPTDGLYDTIHESIRFNIFGNARYNVFERIYKPGIEKNIYDTLYEPSYNFV